MNTTQAAKATLRSRISRGTHYRGIESQAGMDGVVVGGWEGAKEHAEHKTGHINDRTAAIRTAAELQKSNPKAWKGWTAEGIAMATRQTWTRDEDGEIWA